MKTEFKAKFLQHVAKRKKEGGFTLIELLVVIIIIGILSAIALPSFLNQANKAKESEAKQYLSAINKGQQAAYTEFGQFNTDINALGVGIKTETENYKYECAVGEAAVSCTAKAEDGAPLRDYLGHVYLVYVNDAESTSRSILCQAKGPDKDLGIFQLDSINAKNSDPTCKGKDMEDL
ncbi:type IV pilin-like G/H family protein [Limnoraphis robusta Tam1]|uniref:type IV pilin-like G/H family protein n=1 Tax=Limnoraphis robusta TaxID=1118279 RepID=UPI002B21625B|nr:type IV pilin-like G/H family protein [Limnoraphis robusta]MEA5538841.1 type IV pilin-like G/H family protein [Limnoraphis robusta Tam1]